MLFFHLKGVHMAKKTKNSGEKELKEILKALRAYRKQWRDLKKKIDALGKSMGKMA